MALAGCVFAISDQSDRARSSPPIFGTISPSGKDVGPFLSIEQAILPQTTSDQHRTAVFAAYNLVGSFAGAVGALAVSLPTFCFMLTKLSGYRFLVWGYVALAILLYGFVCAAFARRRSGEDIRIETRNIGLQKSRGMVAKLAGLFALDAFAGGFIVQSIVAYWFYLRFRPTWMRWVRYILRDQFAGCACRSSPRRPSRGASACSIRWCLRTCRRIFCSCWCR